MISQTEVKEFLEYNQHNGDMLWVKSPKAKVKVGDRAGYQDEEGYIRIKFKGIKYRAHHLVWLWNYGYLPENDIDHIDRNTTNNKINNLREVSRTCNNRNSKVSIKNNSGVKGVGWSSSKKKWKSSITINNKTITIKTSKDFVEAVSYRFAAEQCLGWGGCDSISSADKYMKEYLSKEHEKRKGRGGVRTGAGRPALPDGKKKVAINVKLPPSLIAWMDRQDQSRAVLIERALREKHGI